MKQFYKLRQKSTGLFSNGGYKPRWTKKGKLWESPAYFKSSIRQWTEYAFRVKAYSSTTGLTGYIKLENIPINDLKDFLDDYEIVEYEVIEKGVSEEVTDFLNLSPKKKAAR